MTNAVKFKKLFGLYATELWAKPEKEFLKWLNSEAEPEREKGKWIFYDTESDIHDDIQCPFCKTRFMVDAERIFDIGFTVDDLLYCPHCGNPVER